MSDDEKTIFAERAATLAALNPLDDAHKEISDKKKVEVLMDFLRVADVHRTPIIEEIVRHARYRNNKFLEPADNVTVGDEESQFEEEREAARRTYYAINLLVGRNTSKA